MSSPFVFMRKIAVTPAAAAACSACSTVATSASHAIIGSPPKNENTAG